MFVSNIKCGLLTTLKQNEKLLLYKLYMLFKPNTPCLLAKLISVTCPYQICWVAVYVEFLAAGFGRITGFIWTYKSSWLALYRKREIYNNNSFNISANIIPHNCNIWSMNDKVETQIKAYKITWSQLGSNFENINFQFKRAF